MKNKTDTLKIACIGNMNNNFFSLSRYLRDFGLNINLFLLNSELDHFYPVQDSLSNINYSWIKQLPWGSFRTFFTFSNKKILEPIKKYNFFIGCGLSPAFFSRIGKKLDIFAPYGWDLYFPIEIKEKFDLKLPFKLILRKHQKKGIIKSKICTVLPTNEIYKKSIEKLQLKHIPLGTPHFYHKEYMNIDKEKLKYSDLFLSLRKKYDIIIFNHCRQIWKTYIDNISYKGNDILIKGFADYLKYSKKKALLILFEYGIDVNHSKNLIKSLGIKENILWLPKLPRKEIMFGLKLSDFGSDILLPISWSANNGTSVEVMAMGKPLFKNIPISPELHKKLTLNRPFPPIVNVKNSSEITKVLLEYEVNPNKYKKIGLEAQKWYKKYMGEGLARKWLILIEDLFIHGNIEIKKLMF